MRSLPRILGRREEEEPATRGHWGRGRGGCRSELERDCLSHLEVVVRLRLGFSGQANPAGVVPWPQFPFVDSEPWHPQCEKASPGSVGFQSSHGEAGARARDGRRPGSCVELEQARLRTRGCRTPGLSGIPCSLQYNAGLSSGSHTQKLSGWTPQQAGLGQQWAPTGRQPRPSSELGVASTATPQPAVL